MKLLVDFLQSRVFNVGIDLRRLNTGMPQHFLHQSQVGATRQEVSRETVSQTVGTDVGIDTGTPGVHLDQSP